MLSNDTQVTSMLNFHAHFRETVIFVNFYKIHDEKCSFLSFSTTRVKGIIWNQHIWSLFMLPNIDKNNYPEETELDTNPSLTLAQTLTLSTGERILTILRPVVVTTPWF